MNFDKLTLKAQEAIHEAESTMRTFNHSSFDVDHLLHALLKQNDGVVPPLLDAMKVEPATIGRYLRLSSFSEHLWL